MGVPIPIGTGIFKLLHKPMHTQAQGQGVGDSVSGSGGVSGSGSVSVSGGGGGGVRRVSLLGRRQRLLETI